MPHTNPVAKVLFASLEHRNSAPSMAMEAASQAELHRLKRYLPLLDMVITRLGRLLLPLPS